LDWGAVPHSSTNLFPFQKIIVAVDMRRFQDGKCINIHDHRRKPADTSQNDFIGADIVSTGAVKTKD